VVTLPLVVTEGVRNEPTWNEAWRGCDWTGGVGGNPLLAWPYGEGCWSFMAMREVFKRGELIPLAIISHETTTTLLLAGVLVDTGRCEDGRKLFII
jgi:hypothetical protein